jgi:proteasome component ECM29
LNAETNQLKSFTYTAIGLLSKRLPSLFSKDLSILTMMFSNLNTEEERVRAAIQDGLTMLVRAYTKPTPEITSLLEQLFLENIEKVILI